MRKMKRLVSIFLVMTLIWSFLPVTTVSAAGSDLSSYVTITGYEIYNEDGSLVVSSSSQESVSYYSNGLTHWENKNVVINWELNLPTGMTVSADDYFTISLFPTGKWSIRDTASSDITVNELGGAVTAGTWSISNRTATIILGANVVGENNLSGTLTTGTICYPNFLLLSDTVSATTIGNLTKYYKYNARTNYNTSSTSYYRKSMGTSTNQDVSWNLVTGLKYLSDKASVVIGETWPGTIDDSDKMKELFIVDTIEDASEIATISTSISTRIYAKGPGGNTIYQDYPLGTIDLSSPIITSEFVDAGTYDDASYTTLNDFKDYVKAQTNGVGSYGIYHDTLADKYYVVLYFDIVPTTNLTYNDVFGGISAGDYLQNLYGSEVIPDADKDWYNQVYGSNDTVYNFILQINVTYNDIVLVGSKKVTNEAGYYYTKDGNYTEDSVDAEGYMYAVGGAAVLSWNSAALIKYDTDGVTGLGGVSFKLQYWDVTSNTWMDYTVNGNLYTGTTSANGQLLVKNLPEGDYRFVETNAAEGYDISAASYYSTKADMQAGANVISDPDKHFTIQSGVDGSYVYATNAKAEYHITYDANEPSGTSAAGTTVDTNTYYYGDTATLEMNNFSLANYVFIGWNTKADGSGTSYVENTNITVTENTTLYAQWYRNTNMVNYNANGGTGSYVDDNSGSGYPQGTAYTVLDSAATGISYAGHTFVGWNTQPDGSGQSYLGSSGVTDFVMPASSVTLYAQWEDTLYKVTYDSNGGSGGLTVDNLSYQSTYTVLGNAATGVSRTGYTFDCWNTKADGSGTDYSMSETFTITDDVVLYARWRVIDYSVTYDANGGAGSHTDSPLHYGDSYIVINDSAASISNTGYSFDGWNTAADGTGTPYAAGATINITGDVTLFARWKAIDYSVTYDANGGSGSHTDASLHYGDSYIVKSDSASSISKAGYTFDGWNTAADGTGTPYAAGATINITGDVTLYASWIATDYSVTYDSNGGSGSHTDSPLHYGDSYIIKSESDTGISYPGHTFIGWNTEPGGNGINYAAGANIIITDNITLYAQWMTNSYTVKYNANGGTGSYTDSPLNYGDSYIVKSDSATSISRAGYTFDGWNTAADGTGTPYAAGETVNIIEDVTLYAQWNVIEYSVTYDANGGTGSHTDVPLYYGDIYTVKSDSAVNISNAGYTFIGWNTEPGGTGTAYAANADLTITYHVTLYAQWINVEPGNWYVNYNANGGTGSKTVTESVLNNHTVQSAGDAGISRTGYEFVEWTTDVEGNNPADPTITAQAEGTVITLYAQWRALEFSVTYNANGGTGSHTDSPVYYNDFYTVKSENDTSINYAGYSFVCWSTQPDGTGTSYDANAVLTITENVTLYAQWTENILDTYTVIYDANGGIGSHSDFPLYSGDSYTVKSELDTNISCNGYSFIGWNTEPDGTGTSYDANDNLTITENVTLYAQWMVNSHTATYNANGGTGSHTDSPLYYGDTYTVKSESDTSISYDGYTFVGWNTAEDGNGTSYSANAVITIEGDIILYAQWKANSTPNPPPAPDDESESESTTESESDESTTATSNTTNTNVTTTRDGNTSNPKTGDQTNVMLLLILLVGSIGGAGFILKVKRKKK